MFQELILTTDNTMLRVRIYSSSSSATIESFINNIDMGAGKEVILEVSAKNKMFSPVEIDYTF
jgi:hypothetical protein